EAPDDLVFRALGRLGLLVDLRDGGGETARPRGLREVGRLLLIGRAAREQHNSGGNSRAKKQTRTNDGSGFHVCGVEAGKTIEGTGEDYSSSSSSPTSSFRRMTAPRSTPLSSSMRAWEFCGVTRLIFTVPT